MRANLQIIFTVLLYTIVGFYTPDLRAGYEDESEPQGREITLSNHFVTDQSPDFLRSLNANSESDGRYKTFLSGHAMGFSLLCTAAVSELMSYHTLVYSEDGVADDALALPYRKGATVGYCAALASYALSTLFISRKDAVDIHLMNLPLYCLMGVDIWLKLSGRMVFEGESVENIESMYVMSVAGFVFAGCTLLSFIRFMIMNSLYTQGDTHR